MKNKILIIDENHNVRISLVEALKREGFIIKDLGRPDLIHDHLKDFKPDLIIMEIEHRSADGRILCDEIKALPGFAEIPVILLTSLDYNKIGLIDCQADAILGKPYVFENLFLTIQNLIGQ